LKEKNLGQYTESFKENDISGHNILELNENDLRDLGLKSIGHRKSFLRWVTEARRFRYDSDDGSVHEDSYNETESPKGEPFFKCVVARGLPRSILEDEDTLFDIENLVFSVYFLDKFEVRDNGIIVTFKSPLTAPECEELKEKFMSILKSLRLDTKLEGNLTIDMWEDGKIVELPRVIKNHPSVEERGKTQNLPGTINYWKDFWSNLRKNGNPEDFFPNSAARLNMRDAREVLATIRDVKLGEIKKDDPGIKHLNGFQQAEIKSAFTCCNFSVMREMEGRKRITSSRKNRNEYNKSSKGICVGMSVEGLPRFITDDDKTVHGIQSLVFRDIPIRRLIVLDDQTPAALRVEFEKPITSEKIPVLGRNLKNFLKAVNVGQEALSRVSIVFLEGVERPIQRRPTGSVGSESEDFLVGPGDEIEMTRSFMIEGIPERYLIQENFLDDMPDVVFEGLPLAGICLPQPTKLADGSVRTIIEIRFQFPLNIQKLPMIAMKLKRFLKRKQIPPSVVNRVTLQLKREEDKPTSGALTGSPVVGLIFKNIPKFILRKNEALYSMESEVFTKRHPICLLQPNENAMLLRITLQKHIYTHQELTNIAQRLKLFLAKQGVEQQIINEVLVLSFCKEKWEQNIPTLKRVKYFKGIEIENVPSSLLESDHQLEELEKKVFSEQRMSKLKVLNNVLRIKFGNVTDTRGIEKIARDLKLFLFQMNISLKQINEVVIVPLPHIGETCAKAHISTSE